MMKRIFSMLLVCVLLFTLTACGSNETGASGGADQTQTTQGSNLPETNVSVEAAETFVTEVAAVSVAPVQDDAIISEADAIKLVLERVQGSAEENLRINLEKDDGRMVYEGELRYEGMEYDFEIEAETGDFIEWEEDRID